MLQANYNVPAAVVAQTLGRLPSGGVANLTVNLLAPGEKWGDRVNEMDIRIAKVLGFGRSRSNVGIDIYNVLNSSAILSYTQTFIPGGQWLRPNTVLTPRFVKVSAQIDFQALDSTWSRDGPSVRPSRVVLTSGAFQHARSRPPSPPFLVACRGRGRPP